MKIDFEKRVLPKVYKFQAVHLLWSGLPVAAASVFTYLAASRLPDGKTPTNYFVLVILALLVFSAYGIEFFMKGNSSEPLERQNFRKKLRPMYGKVIVGLLLVSAMLSWFVPENLWRYGVMLAICSGLYFWTFSKISSKSTLMALREPFSAILYTLGIWGSSLFLKESGDREINILCSVFCLIVFQYFLLQSHFNALEKSSFPSLARWLGKKKTGQVIYLITGLIFIVCVAVCYYTTFRYVRRFAVILTVMTICQSCLFNKSDGNYRKYLRTLSELTGLLPILLA